MAQSSTQASIDRAMTKARQVAAQGISAHFIGWAAGRHLYRVASASHADHEYLVTARRVAYGPGSARRAGVATECQCEAAGRGLACWHRAMVQLAMRDAQAAD